MAIRNGLSRLKDVLPLHVFVRKQQVLQLYKEFRRAGRQVPDMKLRQSIKSQVLYEFRTNKDLTDTVAIKTLMAEARRNLEKLRAMSQPLGVSKSATPDADKDDPEQHRVGTGWPWARGKSA